MMAPARKFRSYRYGGIARVLGMAIEGVLRPFLIFPAIAMTLNGCGSLVGAQDECSAANQSFLPMWTCIRGAVAEGNAGMMNNAQGVRYLAVGNSLAEQVRSGRMTDAQAKAQLAIELERDNAAYNAEQRACANTRLGGCSASERQNRPFLLRNPVAKLASLSIP